MKLTKGGERNHFRRPNFLLENFGKWQGRGVGGDDAKLKIVGCRSRHKFLKKNHFEKKGIL